MEPLAVTGRPAGDVVLITRSAQDTRSLGRTLAAALCPGDVMCLHGELGAGKTTFIQGVAEGLGVSEPATSPSFTLLHEHRGRLPFYHLDLYRLAAADLTEVGVEEVLGSEAVVAVEWAERLPAGLCPDALVIVIGFDPRDEARRRIRFRASGPRGRRMLEAVAATNHVDPCP